MAKTVLLIDEGPRNQKETLPLLDDLVYYPPMVKKRGITFRISLRFGPLMLYTLVIAAIATALAIWYAKSNVADRQVIAYGSSLFGAMIALSGLLYTAQNLRDANEEKRSIAAARFVERWNAPEFFEVKSKWRKLQEEMETLSPEQRANALDQNLEKRTTVVEMFNFMEEMAVAINTSSVDEELLRRFFKTIVTRYYEDYETWIRHHREHRRAPRFCCELEIVAPKWKKSQDP
jgi:hypothetical protein